jgi:thiopurine S-methyltransferase
MRPAYALHLQDLLPAARILLVTLDYDQAEMAGPPFAVSEAEVRALYEERFVVREIAALDIWAETPRYRERGLSRIMERVFSLHPRQQA